MLVPMVGWWLPPTVQHRRRSSSLAPRLVQCSQDARAGVRDLVALGRVSGEGAVFCDASDRD